MHAAAPKVGATQKQAFYHVEFHGYEMNTLNCCPFAVTGKFYNQIQCLSNNYPHPLPFCYYCAYIIYKLSRVSYNYRQFTPCLPESWPMNLNKTQMLDEQS